MDPWGYRWNWNVFVVPHNLLNNVCLSFPCLGTMESAFIFQLVSRWPIYKPILIPWSLCFSFLKSNCSWSKHWYWFRHFKYFDFLLIWLKYNLLAFKRTLQIIWSRPWSIPLIISIMMSICSCVKGSCIPNNFREFSHVSLIWSRPNLFISILRNISWLFLTLKYKCH